SGCDLANRRRARRVNGAYTTVMRYETVSDNGRWSCAGPAVAAGRGEAVLLSPRADRTGAPRRVRRDAPVHRPRVDGNRVPALCQRQNRKLELDRNSGRGENRLPDLRGTR